MAKSNTKTMKDEEVVLLIRVLASDVNLGYHEQENLIIKVNGTDISNLNQLVSIVESSKGEFITFEDSYGKELVIDRTKAGTTNPDLLKTYRINSDRSDNLMKVNN